MTYTYAVLEVSQGTYAEIEAKFREAGYDHAFHEEELIDMHGVALRPASTPEPFIPHSLTDAQVAAICERLLGFNVPVGRMKWALAAADIITSLPDGT